MRIRKQVYELLPADLDEHPVWEFALDEEGEEGQDEATVRPFGVSGPLDAAEGLFVVRARFTLADGSKLTGYLTPPLEGASDLLPIQGDDGTGTIQPTIVTDEGQVGFWFGTIRPDRDTIVRSYELLGGRGPSQVFPLRYESDVELSSGPVTGELKGFLYVEAGKGGSSSDQRYVVKVVHQALELPRGPEAMPVGGAAEPHRSPLVRFGMRFFAVVLVLAAPLAGYHVVIRFLDARRSLTWPTTQGEVTEARVEERQPAAGKRSFKPRVAYRYTVDGREYVGQSISLHDVGYGSREVAQRIVDAYPVGSTHRVYYDPRDGSRALLEPGVSWRAYLFLAVPVIMLAFGVLLFRAAKLLKPNGL